MTSYPRAASKGIEKGIEKGMRNSVLSLGRKRFGLPSESIQAKLQAIHDSNRLQEYLDRLLDVSSWEELLGE